MGGWVSCYFIVEGSILAQCAVRIETEAKNTQTLDLVSTDFPFFFGLF